MQNILTLDVEKFQKALKATNNIQLAKKAELAYNTVRYHLSNEKNAHKIPISTFLALCAAMEVNHMDFLKVSNPTENQTEPR